MWAKGKEACAILRGVRLSNQKGRLIADLIRGMKVRKALQVLAYARKKAAFIIKKVLLSAMANAENNQHLDVDELKIKEIYVEQARSLRRTSPRAKGRGNRISKPTCHIFLKVGN